MKLNTFINRFANIFLAEQIKPHDYRKLDNWKLADGLDHFYVSVALLINTSKNPITRIIAWVTGKPISHFVAILNSTKAYTIGTLTQSILKKLYGKLEDFYKEAPADFPDHLIMASADQNGNNYMDVSQIQGREMIVFGIFQNPTPKADAVVAEFLSDDRMNRVYDSTGLFGQFFRKFKKLFDLFDDEKADYCSEQADLFRKHGTIIAPEEDSSPRQIYDYCLGRFPILYSSLKKKY